MHHSWRLTEPQTSDHVIDVESALGINPGVHTCSRYSSSGNISSRYTPFLVVWTGSKESCIPLEQFQLEHGQISMFSEQIAPLVRLRNEVWTSEAENMQVGLAKLLPEQHYQHGECTLIWPHSLRSVYTIRHTAQTDVCRFFKSERRGTENISQCSQSERSCTELVLRTFCRGRVPRTYMNL